MDTLQNRFAHSMQRLHLPSLPCAVFEQAPAGLRFRIGGEEDIYLGDHRKPNGAYVENAVERALSIYGQLPMEPDILRIDSCSQLFIPSLPEPDQRAGASAYWSIGREPVFLRKLFRAIIRAEIDPAGLEELVSNVYFLNSRDHILFQLYDDRGADVAAPDRELLRPMYEACGEWILDGEREKIRRMFEG